MRKAMVDERLGLLSGLMKLGHGVHEVQVVRGCGLWRLVLLVVEGSGVKYGRLVEGLVWIRIGRV